MGGVGDGPGPVQLLSGMELGEPELVELVPDTGGGPVAQSPPAAHPGAVAQLPWEPVPADAGDQHEADAVEAGSVVEREPAGASAGGGAARAGVA